jgi:hypothetical protein
MIAGQGTAFVGGSESLVGADKKYCADCGKVILRRAELCPGCGCRQVSAPDTRQNGVTSIPLPELQSPFVKQMALLLILNFLWSGLGNLAIGDKRGWSLGFFNWLIFALSIFTLWIPSLLFFAFCGYAGYQFLTAQASAQG